MDGWMVCHVWIGLVVTNIDHFLFPFSRDTDPVIQHKRAIEKEALKEYWEKRGGEPAHH